MTLINKEYLISEQIHPFDEKIKISSSQVLVNNAQYSLCNTCIHKTNGYKDCSVANLLHELAITTGVSTLVKWCPSNMYSFDSSYSKGSRDYNGD